MTTLAEALDFPDALRARQGSFELVRAESLSPAQNGVTDVFERAKPRWSLTIQTGPMSEAELRAYRGWFARLRGSQLTFKAWDPWAERPILFPASTDNDGASADTTAVTADSTGLTADETLFGWGEPRLTGVSVANRTVALDRLSGGATIKAGDPLSYEDGINLWRVVATEDRTATSAGVISALPVDPVPVALASYPAAVQFYRAACEMRIRPDSVSVGLDYQNSATIQFEAFQVIRST